MPRYLVITGDDLGIASDVDRATLEAADEGLVTSVEIMPSCPTFDAAARALRERPNVDLGIHLTLTSELPGWRFRPLLPVERVPSLVGTDQTCHRDVETLRRSADPRHVCAELDAQVEAVHAAGLRPSHLSQHMFALDAWAPVPHPIWGWMARTCLRHSFAARVTNVAAARWLRDAGVTVVDRVIAETYDVPASDKLRVYSTMIERLEPGVTEMIVHCGFATPALRAITGSADRRQRDYELMVDGALRSVIEREGVELVSYRDVPPG